MAKTITVASLLQARAQELIYAVSLENLGTKDGGAIETAEQVSPLTTKSSGTPPAVPVKASDLWWLDAIKAREAWNYSLGSNATVAVLDDGFGIVRDTPTTAIDESMVMSKPPDFRDRVVFHPDSIGNPLNHENYLRNCLSGGFPTKDSDCDLYNLDEAVSSPNSYNLTQLKTQPGHGLWATSLLASGDNDKDGIVGVAPRAKILPMKHDGGVETPISALLDRLYKNFDKTPVDVVSISLSREINLYDLYYANIDYSNKVRQAIGGGETLPIIGNDDQLNSANNLAPSLEHLFELIAKLSKERKVIFVAAAGNNGHLSDYTLGFDSRQNVSIPAAMNYVIAAGGYKLVGGNPQKADFSSLIKDFGPQAGSNYGSHINIWAPGKDLWVQGYDEFDESLGYKPTWTYVEGTSFATPLVAGT